jgi:glucose/arabinose dehydrogenase
MPRSWTTPFRLSAVVAVAAMVVACGGEEATQTIPVASPEPTVTGSSSTVAEAPATTSSAAETSSTTDAVDETTVSVAPLQGLAYERFLEGLAFPIAVIPERVGSENVFVALKGGEVLVATPEGETRTVLDISDRVRNEGERGFLGIAVHPDDPARFFAHYSDGSGSTTVSEFVVTDDGAIDPGSEEVVFTASQPAGNHNGGWIQFGSDGKLYLGLGDGGGANDQFGNGQKDTTPLAGLVRIDVDTGEAEKYAKGLRNPWRFWIEDDLVYVADVGQNAFEEVSVAPMQPGVNYGWSIMEGFHCFQTTGCDQSGLQLPVVEVEHGDAGTCSITGGVVYHGVDIPELAGHYLYSDYCGGWLRSFRYENGEAVDQTDWTESVGTPGQVVSFGYGPLGEIYVLTTGDVLEITPVR